MMRKLTNFFVILVKRYLPNPYALGLLLTIFVAVLGVINTDNTPVQMLQFWNNGLYSNLAFIFQMCLIMFFGHTLALAPVVEKNVKKVAAIPKTRTQAVLFSFFISYVTTFINWGLGLVVAAMVSREIAILNKGKKYDFGILVAAAYIGCQLPGLSSAIPLTVATPKHFLEEAMGIIPLSGTMFATWNIITMIVLLIAIMLCLKYMVPNEEDSIEGDASLFASEAALNTSKDYKKPSTFSEKLENSIIINYLVVLMGLYIIVTFFMENGFNPTINIIILIFMTLGMLAHKTPKRYLKAVNESIRSISGIVLLYPLYFGIMAMMRQSGLATQITQGFAAMATAKTLPLYTFWSAGLVNLLVPSGGGQWAVQGPVMIEAAKALGADFGRVTMAVCWGDLWTNLVQPFWAIPVLAIAKLDVKDVMGYCVTVSIIFGIVVSLGIVLL